MNIFEFLKQKGSPPPVEPDDNEIQQNKTPVGQNIYQVALNSYADKLNQYEANFADLDQSITADYDRYVDLGRQLDDIQVRMSEAPQELQFNLSVKYEELRNQHNSLVDKLKADTEKQKQLYTDYNQTRQEYERDYLDFQRLIGTQVKQQTSLKKSEPELTHEEKLLKKFTSTKDTSYWGGVSQDPTRLAESPTMKFLIKSFGTGKMIEKTFPEEVKHIKEMKKDIHNATKETVGSDEIRYSDVIAEIHSRITGEPVEEVRGEISEFIKQGGNVSRGNSPYKEADGVYKYIHSMDNPKTALDSMVYSGIAMLTAGQLVSAVNDMMYQYQYVEATPEQVDKLREKILNIGKLQREGKDNGLTLQQINENMMAGDKLTVAEQNMFVDMYNHYIKTMDPYTGTGGQILLNPKVIQRVFMPSQILSNQAGFLRLPQLAQEISNAGGISPAVQNEIELLSIADKIQLMAQISQINPALTSALAGQLADMLKVPEISKLPEMTVDEIEKDLSTKVDSKLDELMERGLSWEDANKHPEVVAIESEISNLLESEYEQHYDNIEDIIKESVPDIDTEFIMNRFGLLDKQGGVSWAVARGSLLPKLEKDRSEFTKDLTQEFMFQWGRENNKDIEKMLSSDSPLKHKGKQELVQSFKERAEIAINRVEDYLNSIKDLPPKKGWQDRKALVAEPHPDEQLYGHFEDKLASVVPNPAIRDEIAGHMARGEEIPSQYLINQPEIIDVIRKEQQAGTYPESVKPATFPMKEPEIDRPLPEGLKPEQPPKEVVAEKPTAEPIPPIPRPEVVSKDIATPEQVKELEILAKQKQVIVETKQGNISKSRFNRLAKAYIGETNPEKMTSGQVEEFKDIIEQVVQRQPWEPPIIPISTKIVPKDFFEDLQFKEPGLFKFITPKEHLMRVMGAESLTKPLTDAKKIADLKKQDLENFLSNTVREINKNVPKGEKIKGWVRNKPTDRISIFRDLMDDFETAPDYLSEGDKKIFNELRALTKDILEQENEVRRRLGLEPIREIKAYVPHFLDELSRQIVQKKYPFPEDVKYWLGRNMPKKIYNPTEMERRVAKELTDVFSKDLGKLLKTMVRYGLRDIYLSEPYSILRAKLNALGDKIPASVRKEIDDYLRYDIFEHPDEIDKLFNRLVETPVNLINFTLKPFGRIISNPAKTMSSIMRRLLISGTIAGRPKLVIRNLGQRLLNMDLYPVKNFLQAQLTSTPKWLKDMIEGSTFWKLSASQGWEDIPKEGFNIEQKALAPYSWSHRSNVWTSMKTGAYYGKEMVDLSKDVNSLFYRYAQRFAEEKGVPIEKLLWTEEDILLEAEEAGSLTQWLYYATGMPQIYRGQIKRLGFSLQSWTMNYFTKHVPEMLTRTLTGRTGRGKLIRPVDRINSIKGLAIISGIAYGLKKAGDYAYDKSLLPWAILMNAYFTSPALQVFGGIFNYIVASDDYERNKARKQIVDAWKLFVPGSLAFKDFTDWISGKKSLDETLFYKDYKRVQEKVKEDKELKKALENIEKGKTSTKTRTSGKTKF